MSTKIFIGPVDFKIIKVELMLIPRELPALVAAYQSLHAAPELSGQEEKTSAYLD